MAKKSIDARANEVLKAAQKAAELANSWIDVSNAVFGIGGAASKRFATKADRVAFTQTEQHAEVMKILDDLRDASGTPAADVNGKVLVRMPRSVHAALLAESEAEGVSLNQLCVSKLSTQLAALV